MKKKILSRLGVEALWRGKKWGFGGVFCTPKNNAVFHYDGWGFVGYARLISAMNYTSDHKFSKKKMMNHDKIFCENLRHKNG